MFALADLAALIAAEAAGYYLDNPIQDNTQEEGGFRLSRFV